MLKPPYKGDELERAFGVELDALRGLLSPAIEDFGKCASLFREKGFAADEPYNALLQAAAREEIGRDCLAQLGESDPLQVSLVDFVELYPNRMLQFMPGWPTPRVSYLACLGEAVYKKRRRELDAALTARWAGFVTEANHYSDLPLPSPTREGIVEAVFKDSLASAGFASFRVPRSSVKKWHPRPGWVDAIVGVLRDDRLDIVLLGETSRPRKYEVLPNFSSEPNELNAGFDKIDVSLWVIPRREIPGLRSAAIRIMNKLFYYYFDFYSFKGLRRIVDAHVAEASVILCKF